MKVLQIAIIFFLLTHVCINAQVRYATKLFDFTPAPGQFINTSPGLPENATGILNQAAGAGKMVSLGFWGGSITLGFDAPVINDPDNPYGVDFTVFGNPFIGSSEPGIVQVMKDENGNGLPDDTWYELRGSDHFLSTTKFKHSITYENPNKLADVPWYDNEGNSGVVVYMHAFHPQQHYPLSDNYPNIDQVSYTLNGTLLKSRTAQGTVWVNDEFDYGYVDNKTIVRSVSKDIPDNPYTLYETEGCGGDAFDIDWAMDEDGNSVYLDQIDFVRIYTSVAQNAGVIGEVSTEVCGIAVVKPNASITGVTDVIVSNTPENVGQQPVIRQYKWYKDYNYSFESYVVSKGHLNDNQNLIWSSENSAIASVSSSGVMTGNAVGETTITCTWANNASISRSFNIKIVDDVPTGIPVPDKLNVKVYPNPTAANCRVQGVTNAEIYIYDITGKLIKVVNAYNGTDLIHLNNLSAGIYIVKVSQDNVTQTVKLIKQ
nr:T9SS type A sorting domain-containing protein [uncultured Carboxylicivirga sp.]